MNMPTPSHEYRLMVERLGQAFREGIEESIGRPVDMGLPGSWDDHETEGRALPIRAIVVRFGRPLRDVALFVSSLKEEIVLPLVQAGVARALEELNLEPGADDYGPIGQFTIEPAVEFETNADATEQCDAFYLDPTIHYSLPMGDLCIAMGSGLLQSAECFDNGVPDPFAEPLPNTSPAVLELGGDIGATEDAGRYEFGDGEIGGELGDGMLETGAIGAASREDRVVFSGGDIGAEELDNSLGTGPVSGTAQGSQDGSSAAADDLSSLADSILAGFDDGDDDVASGALGGDVAAGDSPDEIVYTDQGPMSVADYEAMLAAQEAAEAEAAAAVEAANAAAAAASAAAAVTTSQNRWASLLSGVEVELSAELGRTNLALGDLTSLVSNSVLTLDQLVDEPVNVYVNGTAYATARLVVVDGEFGIEIVDVVGAAQLAQQLAA